MIERFEPGQPTEPEDKNHLQWLPAIGAGLIAGAVLLIVPRGSPWSTITFFLPVIMGRVMPDAWNFPLMGSYLIHLALSVIYSLIISRVVVGVTQLRAVITGGIMGLFLYFVNFAVASFCLPEVRGNEFSVLFAHFVFGAIVGGAYRGLLRRKTAMVPSQGPIPPTT
jgi:hypothetical protein